MSKHSRPKKQIYVRAWKRAQFKQWIQQSNIWRNGYSIGEISEVLEEIASLSPELKLLNDIFKVTRVM